jgi:alcohol dehydrogenase
MEFTKMLFPLQVKGYQGLMKTFKVLAQNVPFPKPTLFTGAGSSIQLCETIAQMGSKKILIVTDAMLVKLGLLDNIQKALTENGVEYVVFDGILPDPTYDQIEAGLTALQLHGCEAVLAVGGGSSIDAAKVISARATNNKPISKLAGMFKVFKACLPLYVIPTTAGTGSEVTVAAVVSDPVTHKKSSVLDPKLVPLIAALDGTLMTGLPAHITAATGMDALTHAVEAFISSNALPDTDANAIAATKLIMENLPKAFKEGGNLEARQNMALASFYAGLAFTKAGVGYVHAIAHNFGAYYHVPHGLANSIALPYILDYSKDVVSDRLAILAEVSGLKTGGESERELAQKFIDHIRSMLKEFNIPDHLDKIQEKDIVGIAKSALREAHYTYAVPKYMNQSVCENLIRQMAN